MLGTLMDCLDRKVPFLFLCTQFLTQVSCIFQLMMMVLCPNQVLYLLRHPGDEMSEVVSRCLPHRQLWVSNLSNVATLWLEVDSNLRHGT